MPKRLASVHSYPAISTLTCRYWHPTEGWWQHLELESTAWFSWLTQEHSFSYTFHSQDNPPPISFTSRPEKRGQQAWKTTKERTTKKYLDQATKLTRQNLDAVGEWFGQLLDLIQVGCPVLVIQTITKILSFHLT